MVKTTPDKLGQYIVKSLQKTDKSRIQCFDDLAELKEHVTNLGGGWFYKYVAHGPTAVSEYPMYWGLFWTGKKPERKEIKRMLVEHGLVLTPMGKHCRTNEPLKTKLNL